MRLIGLSGYARSGKDTVAEVLVKKGWKRLAFADTLRNVLLALDPVVGVEDNTASVEVHEIEKPVKVYKNTYYVKLSDVIDLYGWDGYKATQYADVIRILLQRLGTEAGRNILGENVWVDATLRNLDDNTNYVVTDCRFVNEAEAIKRLGGMIVRIERKGFGPINDHPSETSLDNYPFSGIIRNDSTLEEFREKIERAF